MTGHKVHMLPTITVVLVGRLAVFWEEMILRLVIVLERYCQIYIYDRRGEGLHLLGVLV